MRVDTVVVSAIIAGVFTAIGSVFNHIYMARLQAQKAGLDDRGQLTKDLMVRLQDEVERLDSIQQRYEQVIRINSFMFGELITVKAICTAIVQMIQMPAFDREQIKLRLEEIDRRINSVELILIQESNRLKEERASNGTKT